METSARSAAKELGRARHSARDGILNSPVNERSPLTPALSPPAATGRQRGESDGERVSVGRVRAPRSGLVKPLIILIAVLILYCGLQFLIPLRTAVQIGAEEGFEVAKATLRLHGHKLYSEVWNDQPPLHTWLITQAVNLQRNAALTPPFSPPDGERVSEGRVRGKGDRQDALSHALSYYSILWPRLVTTVFAGILLVCVFVICWRMTGLLVGTLTVALLIASPGFLELSSSCMLEIPSLAMAIAGLCVLLRTKWHLAEILCGVLFGIAALMKLVPMYLLPVAALIVWLRQREASFGVLALAGSDRLKAELQTGGSSVYSASSAVLKSFRSLLLPLFVLGVSLVGSFVLIDWLIERGAYLVHFQQSWSSHFGGAKSFEYGSPAEHAFDWSILLKNWDVTIPAVLGISALIVRLRKNRAVAFPLAWLALSLIVFTNHKPWWSYYYVHIAIPLCWCAAVGIEFVCSALARRFAGFGRAERKRGKVVRFDGWRAAGPYAPVILFALCAVVWMGARVYLQVAGIRNSPQLYTALVLKEIERLKPFSQWMYTDQLVYSFHADIPMPPPLAVVPLKRLWTGEMTNTRIAAEMLRFKPEIILLRNDGREVSFQELLETDYRMIYQDDKLRLYADRATIKQADSGEVQGTVGRHQ